MNRIAILFVLLLSSVLENDVYAQLVNGCGFLQQNRLEIGIANNGAYGTPEDAPAGYHPNNNPLFATMFNPTTNTFLTRTNALGFVADYDSNGWTVGTPPYIGDYFLPGTPQEGWSVEVNGVRCDAFSSNYQTNGTTGFSAAMTGTNQFVTTTPTETRSVWNGNFGDLNIKQTTSVKQNKLYFTGNVKFYNTGTTTLNNVYYMRTLDPDNDVSVTNNFTTINEITYQLPNFGNKSLVGCTSTINANAYLGLGTIDCRSKVFICQFGLFPPGTPNDTLGALFNAHPDLIYTGTYTQDVGVGIIYQIGNILPGDSSELNFAYILNVNQLDEALDAIKPKWLNNSSLYQSNDTIYACSNTTVPVSIVNGDNYNWSWSSTAPLSNTSGISNNVTFGTTPIQVMAVGTGICNDTIIFYLAPTDTVYTTINASICSGQAYVFNGISYTTAGSYSTVVTTPSGCDSIVTLVLGVGANSSTTLNASVCQGVGYLFNGNVLNTAGTYFDTLANAVGCDSLIILNLLVGTTTYGSFNAAICQGQSYAFNGSNLTSAGAYLDTIANSNGCDSVITLNLTIKPLPLATFTVDRTQICSSEQVVATYTGTMDPNNIHSLTTSGGTIVSGSGVGPYTIEWSTPGTKTLTWIVTLDGCQSIPVIQTVTVIEGPDLKLEYDKDICIDGTATIEAISSVSGLVYNWTLNDATLVSGSTASGGPLELSWNTLGTKTILVQLDNQGCLSNIDTARITVHELPTANIISKDGKIVYCELDVVRLSTDAMPNAFYQWTPIELFTRYDYNDADLIIYDTTLITTKVTTAYGCIAYDTLTLFTTPCDDYFIPNVFTPNGDGKNEVFKVFGLKTNAHIEMLVYNRWGQLMFQSSDPNLGWNGFYKGAPSETGVYFYHIKITFPTGETKIEKGDVTILR
jgi:gliding motility-associated-like protein